MTSSFAVGLPKCELHVHIEGTLEPELMFSLSKKNGIELPFDNVDEARESYQFTDLQSFLDIYYRSASVLRTRDDFASLMAAYLDRARAAGVRRAEVFIDPQTHTERGIGFDVFMGGFSDAIADTPSDLSVAFILCFLRHLPAGAALETLHDAEGHLDGVVAVGLDSSEKGNPPYLFASVYDEARVLGLRAVAHAGEEGPPEYVRSALDDLGVERVDHGVRCLDDDDLVDRLVRERVPLTVCPLSNVALQVVPDLPSHPLPQMIDRGLNVSIHSDDPAFFGGGIAVNYGRVATELSLAPDTLKTLAANSVRSSFLDDAEKKDLVGEVEAYG